MFSDIPGMVKIIFFIIISIFISIIDIKNLKIPDLFSVGTLVILIIFDLFIVPDNFPPAAISAIISFAIFFFLRYLTKGIGFGDVKYATTIGYFSGFDLLPIAFFFSSLSALIAVLIGLCTGKFKLKDKIAFGPFLAFGAILTGIIRLIEMVYN